MPGDTSAAYYYVWTAVQAILPIALGAFVAGLFVAWLIWGIRKASGNTKGVK